MHISHKELKNFLIYSVYFYWKRIYINIKMTAKHRKYSKEFIEDDCYLPNVSVLNRTATNNNTVIVRQADDDETSHRRIEDISKSYLGILESIGEDPNREGLKKTPQRAAKAILHFTKGYEENISGMNTIIRIVKKYSFCRSKIFINL